MKKECILRIVLAFFMMAGLLTHAEIQAQDAVSEIIRLTNAEREKRGLSPLRQNTMLDSSALDHAKAMAEQDFLSHTNPQTGSSPADRIAETGYRWSRVAENISAGNSSPADVVKGWMKSPGHRANILKPDLQEIGVGYAYDEDSDHVHYWVQNFGTPMNIRPAPQTRPRPAKMGDNVVKLEKRITPLNPAKDEELTANLTIRADDRACTAKIRRKPMDVVLAIDKSGSMENPVNTPAGSQSKLKNAKKAAKAFVDEMDMKIDRVAIVKFNDKAALVQELSKNPRDVKKAVDDIHANDGTSIDDGLEKARTELEAEGRSNATLVIVILSDGDSPRQAAVAEAAKCKSAGIRVVSVGIGNEVNKKLMRQIASLKDYHYSPDTSDLKEIYISVAENIREFMSATQLTLRHEFVPQIIEIIPESVSHNGKLHKPDEENPNGTIIWHLDALGSTPHTFTYRARVKKTGTFFVDGKDQVTYTLCGKKPVTFKGGPRLWVKIEEKIEEPGVLKEREKEPEPKALDAIPKPSQPVFCSNEYWWLPALLLPLILVILLFLILWWWSRKMEIHWLNLWREWPLLCKIFSILILLFLLFLTFLAGREFVAGLCKPTESVYFWQWKQGKVSGIFVANESDTEPVSMLNLNQQGCMGCHAVSSTSRRIAAGVGTFPFKGAVFSLAGKKVDIPDIDALYFAWSPEGERLAFSDLKGDINILDLETNKVSPLPGASDPNIYELMPSWSPDGETIAFVRTQSPVSHGLKIRGPCDICTVPSDGGIARPLKGASRDGFNYYPAYSPDGSWLAFTRHTTGMSTYADNAAEIFLIPASGGERIRIAANDAHNGTPLENVSNSWPTWSENGKRLAFNSKRRDASFDIFVTTIDDNGKSGPAAPLTGASEPGVFEHTPFWGQPPQLLPLLERLLNLWPWLIPLLLLFILRHLLCRQKIVLPPKPLSPPGKPPKSREPLQLLESVVIPPPEWNPVPTLVIGLGGSGRRILTHLKKNLLDAGDGKLSDKVKLLLLDTGEAEVVNGEDIEVNVNDVKLDKNEQFIMGKDLRPVIEEMIKDSSTEPEMRAWFPLEEYTQIQPLTDAEMDARRTTHGRRPMGRALIFHDFNKGESSGLWQALKQAIKHVIHGEKARVMIVSSLAGGYGSAVLADTAYLARRAAQVVGGNAAAVISGFLMTDNAHAAQTRSNQLKLNTMGSLRELGRFLLARGRPFPMTYVRGTQDSVLNSFMEGSVFDDVFLFDGQRPRSPLTLLKPEHGMFPLVADMMTVFIDEGSQFTDEVRANLRTQAAQAQLETGEPAVSTLGGYTYRLPLRDLARSLQIRFVHDLLMLYLAGSDHKGKHEGISQNICKDRYEGGLITMADHFLRGKLYGDGIGAGSTSELVAELSGNRNQDRRWLHLDSKTVDNELTHFQAVLEATLLRMLNGKPGDDITTANTGKLAYTLAFLDELNNTLDRARQNAEYVGRLIQEDDMKNSHAALLRLIQGQKQIVSDAGEQITEGARVFMGTNQEAPLEQAGGLLGRFRERLVQEHQWRKEMCEIKVRHTFADDAFYDELYARHFAPKLSQGLEILFWKKRPGSGLEFSVALENWKDMSFTGSGQGVQELGNALMELAASLGTTIWKERLDPLFDHEERGLWEIQKLRRQEADQAQLWSGPVTTVQTAMARDQYPHHYLWVNASVRTGKTFAKEVRQLANIQENVRVLEATDPYSSAVLTSLDILPLSTLDCIKRLQTHYKDAHQLDMTSATRDSRLIPGTIHVFAAEQNALTAEMRLAELKEPVRLFHPLFAGALENLENARIFVLAFVMGWIKSKRFQAERGEWRDRYALILPDQKEAVPISRGDRQDHPVALIVRTMQDFVLGHPHEEQQLPHPELVRTVSKALEKHPPGLEKLREFLVEKPAELASEKRIGVNDFWSFAQLVVIDELTAMANKGQRLS